MSKGPSVITNIFEKRNWFVKGKGVQALLVSNMECKNIDVVSRVFGKALVSGSLPTSCLVPCIDQHVVE